MKKIGSLVLVLVMAASMAACSDANTIESKATGENSQVATTVDGGGEAKNQQSE